MSDALKWMIYDVLDIFKVKAPRDTLLFCRLSKSVIDFLDNSGEAACLHSRGAWQLDSILVCSHLSSLESD